MTRRQLYLELTGQARPRGTTAPMLVGQTFEPAIVGWYLARHPGYAWDATRAHYETAPLVRGRLHAHPDGLITLPGRARASVVGEVKIPLHDRYSWVSGVPLWYQWQVQGVMAVAELEAAVVVECLDLEVRGTEVVHLHCREHLVEREESVHETILAEVDRFFDEHVIPRRPPAAEARDLDDLKREPPQEGLHATLPPALAATVDQLLAAREAMAGYERLARDVGKQRAAMEVGLLSAMGAAEVAALPDGTVLRRKKTERRGHTVAPSTTYRLVIEKETL